MIRWQARSDAYAFTNSRVQTTQKNDTHVTLAVCPLLSFHQEVKHAHTADKSEQRTSNTITNTKCWPSLRTPYNQSNSGTGNSISAERGVAELPLLYIPTNESDMVQTSALAEAASTGAINSTTGALVGVGACLLFGPVGASLVLWGAAGAGATAVVTGTAQGCVASKSNSLRAFATECNDFLIEARTFGLTPAVVEVFKDQVKKADTWQKRQMLRDIAKVCRECLGDEPARPLTNAAQNIPMEPRPSAPSSSGYSHGGMYQGYNHSPAGAVSAAMGGR